MIPTVHVVDEETAIVDLVCENQVNAAPCAVDCTRAAATTATVEQLQPQRMIVNVQRRGMYSIHRCRQFPHDIATCHVPISVCPALPQRLCPQRADDPVLAAEGLPTLFRLQTSRRVAASASLGVQRDRWVTVRLEPALAA